MYLRKSLSLPLVLALEGWSTNVFAWMAPVAGVAVLALVRFADASVAPKVYWTSSQTSIVQRANLDGSNPEVVLDTGLQDPEGLAIDLETGKLIIADDNTDEVTQLNLDGTGPVDIIIPSASPDPQRDLFGLVVDPVRDKIYWAEGRTGKVRRCNRDGTGQEDILTGLGGTGSGQPVGIAIQGGDLYVALISGGKILRAAADVVGQTVGQALTVLSGLPGPDGIAIDGPAGQIYWSEQTSKKIRRANLDGTGATDVVVIASGAEPQGVALDLIARKVYWSDNFPNSEVNDRIKRADMDGVDLNVQEIAPAPAGYGVAILQSLCGDNVVESSSEQCDDGNLSGSDGCSASCAVEAGWNCAGSPSVCIPICGDGLIRGSETCDDGNTAASDCCSPTCATEPDCNCAGEPSVCTLCGDGVKDPGEQCDLGPAAATSGNCPAPLGSCSTCARSCSADCKIIGRCTTSGACCTTAADCDPGEGCCGNGTTETPEQCDDGNRVSGDCCSSSCQTEPGSCVPLTCCPRGAEIAGATVLVRKKVKVTKLGGATGDEQLKSGGEAILLPGQDMHPCSEGMSYCLEDASGIIYGPNPVESGDPAVAGGQMKQPCLDTLNPRRVRASYTDKGKPPTGSDPDGVKAFSLKNIASQPNKYKYKVQLRDVNLTPFSAATTVRQTLVLGDTCLVLNLTCTPAGTTTAVCVPSP